jgi:excisionase family DNA binding protein
MTTSTTEPRTAETDRQPLLSIGEVAEWLGVGIRHIRRLVDDRRIPFIKWGHLLRFDPDEIETWLAHHRVKTRRPLRPRDLVTEDR